MTAESDNIDERVARLAEQQREMHAQTMAEFAELKTISQQQAETAKQQAENAKQQAETAKQQADSIRSLAGAFSDQARAYREFSRNLPDVMEATRRSAQASEGALYMAQRTLEAVRDLIEELRQQRG
ncbi:hypothetical protein [Argonema antarcticum]|uniref:hypothetical protein n=1 Tax=Argonema antarcticum TaxID=2942763 RepID=UPI002012F0AC|nr:hypothetical protein [Argonema antarcticum]MCL1473641.1 hypothetical protein [Argonema antarcticum A004/B2]